MYYIHQHVLGKPQHLHVTDSESYFTDTLPPGALVADGTTNPGTLGSFSNVSKENVSVVPENIRRTLEITGIPPQLAGLSHLMRQDELAHVLAEHKSQVIKLLEVSADYSSRYVQNVAVLNSCARIKFSTPPEGIRVASDGFCDRILYDTALTKTGRMKVISGPNVLTLKKGFKNMLCSRFHGGVIAEIDYSALEPRTALAIAGGNDIPKDVYNFVSSELGIPDRETAKQVTISFLYGAKTNTICRLTGLSSSNILPKLKRLKQIFSYDNVISRIRQECRTAGYFTNHAGRPLFPTTDKEGTLFNNYAQSSAVDVALSGFSALFEMCKDREMKAVPLFFIHDAVVLDIPPEEFDELRDFSTSLPTYLGVNFPTKLKILNN